jgi:Fur family ferric uptake transcriptional regulator
VSPASANRRTPQRDAIRDVIAAAAGPLSAPEILRLAKRRSSGLGQATVYRNVRAMVDAGELVEVDVPGEPPRHEPAGRIHHHHFLCRACQKLFDVQGCPGNLATLTPSGFVLERHELTLVGLCAGCAPRRVS